VGGAPAWASTAGIGSTTNRTTALSVQLGSAGSLLNLSVLSDTGSASTDAHAAPASASTSLSPLSVASSVLHLGIAAPTISTKSPGGPSDFAGQSISLTRLGVPATVATGTVNVGALHSDYSSNAAHSSMSTASLDKFSVAGGGLISVDSIGSTLGAQAISSDADGSRVATVGTVKVLDLGASLQGLGVSPAALPVNSLSALLATAHIPVTGLPANTDLHSYVVQLESAITGVRATVNPTASQVTGTVDATTASVLKQAGISAPASTSTVADVNGVVSQLQKKVNDVLANGLAALDSQPLVQIDPTTIGITTKASDTVANSAAKVTTLPLSVHVAGITLPALDASSTVADVNAALATANGAIDNVLATVGLPSSLVTVSVLDQASSVGVNGSYTQAVAGISGVTVKIAAIDPAVIKGAVAKLQGTVASSVLGSAASQVPLPMATAMGALDTAMAQAAPLTGGATVQIASVGGSSTYSAAATPVTPASDGQPGVLPHTGANPAVAVLGVLFASLFLAAAVTRRFPGLALSRTR
jgi:hypothetical protein